MPIVHHNGTGKNVVVKNLGWLLQNAHRVASIEVISKGTADDGCTLLAQLVERGATVAEFRAECASFSVMHDWVRRPRFAHAIKYYHFPEVA